MNSKRKYISYPFGDDWDRVKDFIDEDGWCDFNDIHYKELGVPDYIVEIIMLHGKRVWRPLSLCNLNHNNGWINVEVSYPEDLRDVVLRVKGDKTDIHNCHYIEDNNEFYYDNGDIVEDVTHWRPLENYPNPLW